MNKENDVFIKFYTTLFIDFERATKPSHLVKVIYQINGGAPIPNVVFRADGNVREFNVLQESVK